MSSFTHPIAISTPLARSVAIAVLMGATMLASPLTAARADSTSALIQLAQATNPAGAGATQSKGETVEQRITDLHTALKITSEEETLWNGVAQAMRENAAAMDELVAATRTTPPQNMSAVDDLNTYVNLTQAHLNGLKNLIVPFDKLYAATPDAQKKVTDDVFRATQNPPGAQAANTQSPAAKEATQGQGETVEQRITSLHAALKITASEEALWNGVAQAMRENAAAMDKLVASTRTTPPQNMSAVDDLNTYVNLTQAHLDGLKNLIVPFDKLYAAMPDAQKKVTDDVFRSTQNPPAASNKYRAPPVVYGSRYHNGYYGPRYYGSPYYYPPPVVYGPSIGISLPFVGIGVY
jgi:hypothetical protein